MPVYDFDCATCGPFAVMRRIAERDKPCRCPHCGGDGSRVLGAPSLALMAHARRHAHATNERAANAPRQSGDGPTLSHRPGCGCCTGGGATLAGVTPRGLRRPEGRPWMISH